MTRPIPPANENDVPHGRGPVLRSVAKSIAPMFPDAADLLRGIARELDDEARVIPPGAVKVGYHPCVGCGNLVPPDVEWCGGCPIPPGRGSGDAS